MLRVEKFISRIKDEVSDDDITIYSALLMRYESATLKKDGCGGFVVLIDGLVYDINGVCNKRMKFSGINEDDEVISMFID